MPHAGRIAYKTGTSYGYRDAWAVGFDGKRTIGVWVGRPDGAPVAGLVGRAAAAPILFDAFARTGQAAGAAAAARPRAHLVVATTARAAAAAAALPFRRAGRRQGSGQPLRIMFPPNGAQLELATASAGRPDPIALKISGGSEPLTVLANGVPVAAKGGRRNHVLRPDGPGFRPADRDRRQRRRRQRRGASAIAALRPAQRGRRLSSLRVRVLLRPDTLFQTRRGLTTMLLDHRTYTVRAGTLRKQLALYEKHGLAAQKRHFGEPLAWLISDTGDVNSYVHIWVYEDAADRNRKRAAL